MAKSKTPFFSMGAKGTVAGALTAQKRGGVTILRSTPKPTDPYSLAQAYQRWDYRDYAYLWTLLTDSQKQVYRTNASKYHITGFSLWMKEKLKSLPDLAGRWHLDEKTGATAYDSSRNANNGTVFGASPTPGLIDGAFYFDGLNDLVRVPHNPTLTPTGAFTLEAFVKLTDVTVWQAIIDKFTTPNGYDFMVSTPAGFCRLECAFAIAGVKTLFGTIALNDGLWHHIAGQWDGTTMHVWTDGADHQTNVIGADTVSHTTNDLSIGIRLPPTFPYKGEIDHPSLWNRVLDPTEILRHSKRRYPA